MCQREIIVQWSFFLVQELVRGYEDRNIPLDVLVTDMDWHITFYKEDSAGKKDQVSYQLQFFLLIFFGGV